MADISHQLWALEIGQLALVGIAICLVRMIRRTRSTSQRRAPTAQAQTDELFFGALDEGRFHDAQAVIKNLWKSEMNAETTKRLDRIAELTEDIETRALEHTSHQLVVTRELIILRRGLIAEVAEAGGAAQ